MFSKHYWLLISSIAPFAFVLGLVESERILGIVFSLVKIVMGVVS